jgi:diguanylate cyclase (GGDEF)-like protein
MTRMSDDPRQPPDPNLSERRFARERQARLQAEAIAEQGLRELFQRQQEIQLLGVTAEAANSATSVADAMQSALDAICGYTKWPVGHYCAVLFDPVEDTHDVVATDTWHLPDLPAETVACVRDEVADLASALGLASRVLATGAPLWIADIAAEVPAPPARPPGAPGPGMPSLRSAFALPVLAGPEVAAVLEFFAPASSAPDRHVLDLFTHIGVQLGRVVERERAQAQSVDAFHDSLTHLPNRARFLQFVRRALKRQERYRDYQFAVLFIDLDGFKAINDSLGHRAGDTLLIQIGRRLTHIIRASDVIGRLSVAPENTVARLGGDEFTILLEDIHGVSDAIRVAERIHHALAAPFPLTPGAEVFASASIGIATRRLQNSTAEDILQDADIAMYRAKSHGKRRSELFDEHMHHEAVARLQLETELRRAVERSEFFLEYQPIVWLESGQIQGFEALLRWQHPRRGIVYPADFIAVAEDGGTILEIGAWALAEACRQLRDWQDRFPRSPLTMAVNLSAKQFMQADVADQISRSLATAGVRPERLSIELTETVAMGNATESRQKLADLRARGVGLVIDDFGTGYSSLSYLEQFPVSSLKIDRSFIARLEDDHDALVRAVAAIGTSLGLTVIAEGVETERQANHLRRLGCTLAQGFYFYRPMTADQIEQVLALQA